MEVEMEAHNNGTSESAAASAAAGEMEACLSGMVDRGSVESHRYFLSRRTLMQMLKDRGYSVPVSDINVSLHDFRQIYSQTPESGRLRFSVTHLSDPDDRVLVFFCGPGSVKLNAVRDITTEIVHKDSISSLILVLQGKMTSAAEKALEILPFKVEIFQITDLLVNITRHVLRPDHKVLTDFEKQEVLKKYSIKENQLPRISRKDAIARYYGLEKGQVVKIIYVGGLTDHYTTYRCIS